jgi:dipeptidyl-peptidase-3
MIFDQEISQKLVNQQERGDLIIASANILYDRLNQKESEDFYNSMKDSNDKTPILYGMNSRLIKKDG